jgi:SprT protein
MRLPLFLVTSKPKSRSITSHDHRFAEKQDLIPFIPAASADYILNWFGNNPVHLFISKARHSKFGDYRPPVNGRRARISVNRNLNPYDFLITVVHEMAHHEVWKDSTRFRRPRPHGTEWKVQYRLLMDPLLNESVFPQDILDLLVNQIRNLRQTARTGAALTRVLRNYDPPDNFVTVESLEINSLFALPSGRTFRKMEKLRKRYRCKCISNGRTYLFSALAKVIPLNEP